jgi:hypothetical protein
VNIPEAGDVCANGDDPPSGRFADLERRRPGFIEAKVADRNIGAGFSERANNGSAYSPRAAGYND